MAKNEKPHDTEVIRSLQPGKTTTPENEAIRYLVALGHDLESAAKRVKDLGASVVLGHKKAGTAPPASVPAAAAAPAAAE